MEAQVSWKKNIFFQFIRFAMVGSMGVVIDFAVLNLLSLATGITSGNGIIPLNVISFGTALTFSFFFNKRWTFKDFSPVELPKKFTLFLLISLMGLTINTIGVRIISTNISLPLDIHPQLWLNIAKVIATGASGLWNFLGYKNLVFKK